MFSYIVIGIEHKLSLFSESIGSKILFELGRIKKKFISVNGSEKLRKGRHTYLFFF